MSHQLWFRTRTHIAKLHMLELIEQTDQIFSTDNLKIAPEVFKNTSNCQNVLDMKKDKTLSYYYLIQNRWISKVQNPHFKT